MPAVSIGFRQSIKEHHIIILVLLLALMNGLLFMYTVPPWQHYDEPGHFEFAWLIANQGDIPQPGTYDQSMRRELAASMIEHGFYDGLDFQPNLHSVNEPIWIGIAQISDRPLYYYLVGIPLRIVPYSDIAFQLYLMRGISLVFYLIAILASYGIARELTPSRHPLRWMFPISLALFPGFTDLMTAVNSDVGATALFSLFLWSAVYLIRHGFSWLGFLAMIILAVLSFYTKNTVSLVVILPLPILLFALLRGSRRRFAWLLVAVLGLLAVLAVFRWGDAAHWYRQIYSNKPTRTLQTQSQFGNYAYDLTLEPGKSPPRLVQVLPQSAVKSIRGNTISLGAWIWASEPVTVRTPILSEVHQIYYQEVEVDTEPAFYAITASLGDNLTRVQVILRPTSRSLDSRVSVYYDGIVLAEGDYPRDQEPEMSDAKAKSGIWGGKPFENLLKNPSAESAWPWINPTFDRLISENYPGRPALVLATLLDWSIADWYFQMTLKFLFQTFWGMFGWGHVPLVGFRPYTILGLITLSGLIGTGLVLIRRKSHFPWEILFIFVLSLVVIWGAALMRGLGSILGGNIFIPSARYAYPAIIPTMGILVVGWLEVVKKMHHFMKVRMLVFHICFITFFMILNIAGLISIWSYYR
ncbi:MAG: hypothetical protein IBX69_18365 [Anaerolineales bacterium]|nr:hypothetical protein [Anaerolineales bacterium]